MSINVRGRCNSACRIDACRPLPGPFHPHSAGTGVSLGICARDIENPQSDGEEMEATAGRIDVSQGDRRGVRDLPRARERAARRSDHRDRASPRSSTRCCAASGSLILVVLGAIVGFAAQFLYTGLRGQARPGRPRRPSRRERRRALLSGRAVPRDADPERDPRRDRDRDRLPPADRPRPDPAHDLGRDLPRDRDRERGSDRRLRAQPRARQGRRLGRLRSDPDRLPDRGRRLARRGCDRRCDRRYGRARDPDDDRADPR